jgi:hypothetical protein
MRSGPCTALLLPLLVLLSPLAAAQELAPVRVLPPRTAFWSPGEGPVELHVAAGLPTRVHLEDFPEPLGLERLETPSLQVLPASETAFILTPTQDFAPGERTRVTVKLGTAPGLELPLLLISQKGEVDGQVRLVRLRAPAPEELGVDSVAQVLNTVPEGQVNLAVKGPVLSGPKVMVRVESILRTHARVFVTLAVWWQRRCTEPWKVEQARLQALTEGGTRVELPLLRVAREPEVCRQRHTLVAPVPGSIVQLFLAVEGEGAPEGFHPLLSGQELSSP